MKVKPARGYALVLWCQTQENAWILRPGDPKSGTRPMDLTNEDDIAKDDRHEMGYDVGRVLAVNEADYTEFEIGDYILYRAGTCPTIGWPVAARMLYALRAQKRIEYLMKIPQAKRSFAMNHEFQNLMADQAQRTQKEARESIAACYTLAEMLGFDKDELGEKQAVFFVPLWAVDFEHPGGLPEPGEIA